MNNLIDSIVDAYEGDDPWAFEDNVTNTINNEENN